MTDKTKAAPEKAATTPKADPDRADEGKPYFSGGVWYGADGARLTDKEAQKAHRAMDKAAAAARAKVQRG